MPNVTKGTGPYVPRKQGGTNDQKRQANQMQGRPAYVTQDTWNSIPKNDQMKWDSLSDKTKLTVTTYHFNKGKEHALRDAEANKMEAKQHDMVFDVDDTDDNSIIEAKNHEVTPPQVNDADMTRKLYEEEGIDFKQILQAQKANTRLFTGVHKLEPKEESDDDGEYTGLKVNSHWFKGFGDDEEEEGSEEFFDEITDVLDAFGATHANATSNALLRTSTSDRNAIALRNRNNTIAPLTSRGGNEAVVTDTIYSDAAAVGTSSIPPMIPPIQEEKTIEDEQEDVEDQEEYYQLASTYLVGGNASGNATPEQIAPQNSSPSPDQDATPPGRPNSNQHLMPVVSTKPDSATTDETTDSQAV